MQLYTHNFHALGSVNKISIVCQSEEAGLELCRLAAEEVSRIEAKYSRYRVDSLLSQINTNAAISPVSVDKETADLLSFAASCYQQSQGLFDITSGVLRKIWDFKNQIVPDDQQRTEICELIGWDKVSWDSPNIFFNQSGMEIDLGGIGKEYAVDQAVKVLKEQGVIAGFVNLGGDLRAWGSPLERELWNFGIADPRKTGEVIITVSVCEAALASSGDYERYFELDGTRYCHILNPKTGMPVNELQSVSVIAPACLLAGSFSTIAMLLGRKKGLKFLKKSGFQYIVIDANGELVKSD
jgi:FAD:protein FMN transferase